MKLNIKVKPDSGKQKIEKISETEYKIYLKSPPKNNKANIELLKLLKKEFNKDARLIGGRTLRKKIVELF